jgi:hypothetical protein
MRTDAMRTDSRPAPGPPTLADLAAQLASTRCDVDMVAAVVDEAERTRDAIAAELAVAERAVTASEDRQRRAELDLSTSESQATREELRAADESLRFARVRLGGVKERLDRSTDTARTASTKLEERKREARRLELVIASHRESFLGRLDPLAVKALEALESFVATCASMQGECDDIGVVLNTADREGFGRLEDPRGTATTRHWSSVLLGALDRLAERGIVVRQGADTIAAPLFSVGAPGLSSSGNAMLRALGERPNEVAAMLFSLLSRAPAAAAEVARWKLELRDCRHGAHATAQERADREAASVAKANAAPPPPVPSFSRRPGRVVGGIKETMSAASASDKVCSTVEQTQPGFLHRIAEGAGALAARASDYFVTPEGRRAEMAAVLRADAATAEDSLRKNVAKRLGGDPDVLFPKRAP